MPRRHRPAGRRSRRSLARLAGPVAIPVALIVAVGAIVAVVDHSGGNSVTDAANANCEVRTEQAAIGSFVREPAPRRRLTVTGASCRDSR